MVREVHRKTLVFTVAKVGEKQTAPIWQEAIVPNATCPDCQSLMTVIISGGTRNSYMPTVSAVRNTVLKTEVASPTSWRIN